MARKKTIKKRITEAIEIAWTLRGDACADIEAYDLNAKWLSKYVAVIKAVEDFVEHIADSNGYDEDDLAMLEKLEGVLEVLENGT